VALLALAAAAALAAGPAGEARGSAPGPAGEPAARGAGIGADSGAREAPGAAPGAAPAVQERDPFPAASATAYLVERDGRALWARRPEAPVPPASLTKIMAALVLLEGDWDPNAWVKVGPAPARATGTRLGLRSGEELRAGDALAATLVGSANDACLALAEHAGGSAEAFVARMNRRARDLGLAATRFANPCGHDAPGHVSSARDLATLTRAALRRPEFRWLVAVERAEVRTRGGRRLEAATGNALLGRLDGARGVKSGYTPRAGKCVVALARRGDTEVLLVLLGAPDRWWTAAGMLERAFAEEPGGG
jgi:D-alanyl-D-alanine carboxypeptidase (penicillin-binding protein 5/6)